jgi:serine/threonine-protein kinase
VEAAISQWKKALEINADYIEALKQTAWVLATHPEPSVRNGVDALKFAQRAAQLSAGKDPAILDTLAASFAEAGRFQEAVKTGREALILASRANREDSVKALKTRIALYQAKSPCRENPPTLAPR